MIRENYSDKAGEENVRQKNISRLCEIEGTAGFVIEYICSSYTPLDEGFMPSRVKKFTPKKGVPLELLVAIVTQWPKFAYKVLNAMAKGKKNHRFITELIPCLMLQVANNHASSIMSLINLKFLELLHDQNKEMNEIMLLLDQYRACGDSNAYFRQLKYFADALSGQELPSTIGDFCLLGARQELSMVLRMETALELYTTVANGAKDTILAAEARVRLNNSDFRFQMAEYYHHSNQLAKAQVYYEGILRDGQLSLDTEHLVLLRTPLKADDKKARLTTVRAAEIKLQDNGKEALLRVALVLVDRLEYLNKNPITDPGLAFQLAEHFITKGKFSEAFPLLSAIPNSSELFPASQNKLVLLQPFRKECAVGTPLLTRQDIIEYVLPSFEKAMAAGHSEAAKTVQELQAELECLCEGKSGDFGYCRNRFTTGIGIACQQDSDKLEQTGQASPFKY